jgi:hypothetical protein
LQNVLTKCAFLRMHTTILSSKQSQILLSFRSRHCHRYFNNI